MPANGPWDATGDDGNSYQIVRIVHPTRPVHSFEGSAIPSGPQRAELKTTTGLNVNYIAKGEYQVVLTNVRLRSSDPSAP